MKIVNCKLQNGAQRIFLLRDYAAIVGGDRQAGSEPFELRVFEGGVDHFRLLSITFSFETII